MLRKALFSQHIHKLFKLLFLLLVSHIYKFLVEELRKSLLCFRPHLCFSCPETRCKFGLREQLSVEVSVAHVMLQMVKRITPANLILFSRKNVQLSIVNS